MTKEEKAKAELKEQIRKELEEEQAKKESVQKGSEKKEMRYKPRSRERHLIPEGKHKVVLYGFVHFGRMKQGKYKPSDRCQYMFEFPELPSIVFDEEKGEQRQAIHRTLYGSKQANKFFAELVERSLSAEELDEGVNIGEVLGRTFRVLITNDASASDASVVYSNLNKIVEMTDDDFETENKRIQFSILWNPITGEPYQSAEDVVTAAAFKRLPEWIQDEIKKTEDFKRFDDYDEYKPSAS